MNLNEIPIADPQADQLLALLRRDNNRWEFRVTGTQIEQRYVGPNEMIQWRDWHDTGYSLNWWLNTYYREINR